VSARGVGQSWILGKSAENPTAHDNEWFILVVLHTPDLRPDFYMLPRNHFAALLWVDFQHWLTEKSTAGKPHQDNPMRNVALSDIQECKEQWDWLQKPTPAAAPRT
jgi:hypothetical protein